MSKVSSFSPQAIEHIAEVLGVAPEQEHTLYRFRLVHPKSGRRLVLEIQTDLQLPDALSTDSLSNVISVYATNAFLQLHNCTGYIASKDLGEVIFFARRDGITNGLVVEREAGCSLYANVDDRLLSADFTQLPPEVVMSSVALSMTEDVFNQLDDLSEFSEEDE